MSRHSASMTVAASDTGPEPGRSAEVPPFEELYERHFDFIWRSLRRLGVRRAALDDAVQEVFLVVHRRLPEFEGRAALKTWLFGIALHVAQRFARTSSRHQADELPEQLPHDPVALTPHDEVARHEAIVMLYAILDGMDADKRAVFVMAELEQMTAPEIAGLLGVPLNTVYSRLRAARHEFEASLTRLRARERWRQP